MDLNDYSQLYLDSDGILLESSKSGEFVLDDDGILQDEYTAYSTTKWSDSGVASEKRSLVYLDVVSDEDDYRAFDARSFNISELEASRDDLTFDALSDSNADAYEDEFPLATRNSFGMKTLPIPRGKSTDLLSLSYDSDYYRKLKDVGVLFDETQIQHFDEDEGNCQPLPDLGPLIDDETEQMVGSHLYSLDDFNNLEAFIGTTAAGFEEIVEDNENVHINRNNTIFYECDDFQLDVGSDGDDVCTDRVALAPLPRDHSPDSNNGCHQEANNAVIYLPKQTPKRSIALVDEDAESLQFDEKPQGSESDELFYVATNLRSLTPPVVTSRTENSFIAPSSTRNSSHNNSFSSSAENRSFLGYEIDLPDRKGRNDALKVKHKFIDTKFDLSKTPTKDTIKLVSTIQMGHDTNQDIDCSNDREKDDILDMNAHQSKGLSKAQSQESFFVSDSENTPKSHKRILPKLHTADQHSRSFKMKSKSTTNIAKGRSPVKPTHMSLAEISRFTVDDTEHLSESHSLASDRSRGEMSTKLKQELMKRKHATELVQQLQTDYDKLLAKYALAELTIDQMRLGAKITLYSDSPTPNTIVHGNAAPLQHGQMINLGSSQRSMVMSPMLSKSGSYSPMNAPVDAALVNGVRTEATSATVRTNSAPSPYSVVSTGTEQAQVVKYGLAHQADKISERLQSFESLLDGQHLNPEERDRLFEKLQDDHAKLRHDYLQAKEDYGMLMRVANDTDTPFDGDKELEGCLFQLGMKFDELHEKVDELTKRRASQLQPYQQLNRDIAPAVNDTKPPPTIDEQPPGAEHETDIDDKLRCLHDQYNLLMDRFCQIKQRPTRSRDLEHETENLVMKLKEIVAEAPEFFQLPAELINTVERESMLASPPSSQNTSPRAPTHPGRPASSGAPPHPSTHPQTHDIHSLQPTLNSPVKPGEHRLRKLNLERLPSKKRVLPSGYDMRVKAEPLNKQHPLSHNDTVSIPRAQKWEHSKHAHGSSLASLPDSGISDRSHTPITPARALPRREGDTNCGLTPSSVPRSPTQNSASSQRKQHLSAAGHRERKTASHNNTTTPTVNTTTPTVNMTTPTVNKCDRNYNTPAKEQSTETLCNRRGWESESESDMSNEEVKSSVRMTGTTAVRRSKSPSMSAQADISSSEEEYSVGSHSMRDRHHAARGGECSASVENWGGRNVDGSRSNDRGVPEYRAKVGLDVRKDRVIIVTDGTRDYIDNTNGVLKSVTNKSTTTNVDEVDEQNNRETERKYNSETTTVTNGKFPYENKNKCEESPSAVGNPLSVMENCTDRDNYLYKQSSYQISDSESVERVVRNKRDFNSSMRPKSENVSPLHGSHESVVASAHSQQLRTLQQEIQRLRTEVKRSNDLKESDPSTINEDENYGVELSDGRVHSRDSDISRSQSDVTTPGRHMIHPPPVRHRAYADSTTDSYASDSNRFFPNHNSPLRPQSATGRFMDEVILRNTPPQRTGVRLNAARIPAETQGRFTGGYSHVIPAREVRPSTRGLYRRSVEREATDTDCTVTYHDTRAHSSDGRNASERSYIPTPAYGLQTSQKYNPRQTNTIPAHDLSYLPQSAGYIYTPLPEEPSTNQIPQVLYPTGTLYYPIQGAPSVLYPSSEPVMHSSPLPRRRNTLRGSSSASNSSDQEGTERMSQCNYCWGSGYSTGDCSTHYTRRPRSHSQSAVRSRSLSRDRHYTQEQGRSQYRVRETGVADCGEVDATLPSHESNSSLLRATQRSRTEGLARDSVNEPPDLNASISAAAYSVRQIDRLTHRMIMTVSDEISKVGGRRADHGKA